MATRSEIINYVITEFRKSINEFYKDSEESIKNTIDTNDTKLYENNTEDDITNITIASDSIDILTNNIKTLEKALDMENTNVEVRGGSVGDTGQMFLIFGTNFPPIKYEGKQVVGVASDAPIYKSLLGKKDGDEVKIGTTVSNLKLLK
ncbi:hypothetical protein [Flammeovirga sp. SubArs3]|uniref:hypothetical protein n=1 Tax=Flammeovirga sp. SubArs3 TaxID=2995316 RepID=UPI00248B968C|nr:hypothetical protein [Flammeovirga sp. SubArs3]